MEFSVKMDIPDNDYFEYVLQLDCQGTGHSIVLETFTELQGKPPNKVKGSSTFVR